MTKRVQLFRSICLISTRQDWEFMLFCISLLLVIPVREQWQYLFVASLLQHDRLKLKVVKSGGNKAIRWLASRHAGVY